MDIFSDYLGRLLHGETLSIGAWVTQPSGCGVRSLRWNATGADVLASSVPVMCDLLAALEPRTFRLHRVLLLVTPAQTAYPLVACDDHAPSIPRIASTSRPIDIVTADTLRTWRESGVEPLVSWDGTYDYLFDPSVEEYLATVEHFRANPW